MYTIATTRFNAITWEQLVKWREKHHYSNTECIYNTPMRISEKIPLCYNVYVLEMRNDINKIGGVGLITNYLRMDKHNRIYKDQNYNRYSYSGYQRIAREEINEEDKIIIRVLEALIFKGSAHMKRGQGITQLSQRFLNNKKIDFVAFMRRLFSSRFG